jgi:uncharacterized membrane protein YphA (DoxX/SURF4 family)
MMETIQRESVNPVRSTWWRGAVLRWGVVYWTLFCLFYVWGDTNGVFARLSTSIHAAWDPVVLWICGAVLAIPGKLSTQLGGSGDKIIDWVSLLCFATIASIVTIMWSALDRRRARDRELRELLRVVVRYTIASSMLGFGIAKVFLLQFPDPRTGRLLQHYGDSSPMGLLWTFIGASHPYQLFSGAMETLGAMLLLFRRTTTLGALVLVTVLANVVMLDFCYDVPAKIVSAHFLVICAWLALPDLGRLANVLVLHRPAQPVSCRPLVIRRWLRAARLIIKSAVIIVFLAATVKTVLDDRQFLAPSPPGEHWYDGSWQVISFDCKDASGASIVTRNTRWDRVRFESANGISHATWHFADDSYADSYTVSIDEAKRAMSLSPATHESPHPTGPVVLHYVQLDPDHLELTGAVGTQQLRVQVERFQRETMLLVNRGFHWVSETAFNH